MVLHQKVAWENYKKYRNEINNKKKREEILFKSEKMQQAMNSPDTLWKTAKGFMGWKSTGSPTQLQIDNKLVTSAHEMAQAMNTFFVGKIDNIRATLPTVTLNTIKICKIKTASLILNILLFLMLRNYYGV